MWGVRLFGGGAFINKTWQTPGRLFGRGVYLREGRLFEQIRYRRSRHSIWVAPVRHCVHHTLSQLSLRTAHPYSHYKMRKVLRLNMMRINMLHILDQIASWRPKTVIITVLFTDGPNKEDFLYGFITY